MLHDGQVAMGRNVEDAEHLIELLTVLACDDDPHVETVGKPLEFLDHRRHFHGVRPRAKHSHHPEASIHRETLKMTMAATQSIAVQP
jgi:hypothetical protein